MTTFEILVLVVLLFNTLLLIALAGSMAKVIKYLSGEEEISVDVSDGRVTRHELQATYADTFLLTPSMDVEGDRLRGWDGISRQKNWDGIPKPKE
jgi:hypothetical protein